jgi:prepilin-type N-terminal cleavage/methylation domain-containing protein
VIERKNASPAPSGYSLLEVVVALALVGIALLIASNALQAHAMAAKRMEVRGELLRSAEDVLESLRGQSIPLDGGPVTLDSGPGLDSGVVVHTFVEVEEREIPGLFLVTVRARTSVRGRTEELELTSMIWRP